MGDARLEGLGRILDVMDKLRGEGGCPWDREQDHRTLRPFLIEETYELLEALDEGDDREIEAELGDLLFQIVFHARLGQERGVYDAGSVGAAIARKLVTRHPHVFGDAKVSSSREVLATWEENKKKLEGRKSVLDGVPRALPALLRAQRLQEKASRVGFDWKEPRGPSAKLEEEAREVRERLEKGDLRGAALELGDMLFAIVNVARHLEVNAEDALREAAAKFERRFRRVEAMAEAAGHDLKGKSIEELDALWEKAKAEERASGKE
jgi:tetrapyrrole methylase family protein/MazG family protein